MFAIVEIAGKQYKVAKDQTIEVDRLPGVEGETVVFDRVLLVNDGSKTTIGTPTVAGAKVTAKILAQKQGEKIKIRRFAAKVRHRRTVGFRAQLTRLSIVSIG